MDEYGDCLKNPETTYVPVPVFPGILTADLRNTGSVSDVYVSRCHSSSRYSDAPLRGQAYSAPAGCLSEVHDPRLTGGQPVTAAEAEFLMARQLLGSRQLLLSRGGRLLAWLCVATLATAFFRPDVLFNWHPVCMSLGYLGCMSEGIIRALEFRSLEKAGRVAAIQRHGYVQLLGLILISSGFYAIYVNKARMGKPHFTSLHGKTGLLTLVVTLASVAMGISSFKSLGILSRFPEHMHREIKGLHRALGAGTWLLSLATVELALPHPAAYQGLLTPLWQFSIACLGVLMLLHINSARPSCPPLLPNHASNGMGSAGEGKHV